MTKLYTEMQARLLADRDEEGATAVEYGLMVSLIAAIIVLAVAAVGQDVLNAFNIVEGAMP